MIYIAMLVSVFFTLLILPVIQKFFACNDFTQKNYRGKNIYGSAGIYFILNILLISAALLLYTGPDMNTAAIIIGTVSAAFAGLLDDNSKGNFKGLSGHFKQLLKGNITSGVLKAFIGLFSASIICILLGYKGIDIIINILLISLTQNFINLLDLRPGRAIKAYWLIILFLIPLHINYVYLAVNLGIVVFLAFYITYEFHEICMMGDTGSNVLGVAAGLALSSIGHIYIRIAILAVLIACQAYAEKKSISSLIERNSVLNYIDMLGRVKNDDKDEKRTGKGDFKQR